MLDIQHMLAPQRLQMLLLCVYLFNVLPNFIPKATVNLTAKLSEPCSRSVELSNPSSNPSCTSYCCKAASSTLLQRRHVRALRCRSCVPHSRGRCGHRSALQPLPRRDGDRRHSRQTAPSLPLQPVLPFLGRRLASAAPSPGFSRTSHLLDAADCSSEVVYPPNSSPPPHPDVVIAYTRAAFDLHPRP